MKPKFNIPIQASQQEINALVRMYGERLYRDHSQNSQDEAAIATWLHWNAQRLVELVALLDTKP